MKKLFLISVFALVSTNALAFSLEQDSMMCKKYHTSACQKYNEPDISSNKIENIIKIQEHLKSRFLYTPDDLDQWKTFGESADTVGFHRGDCDDFVHTLLDILHKQGIPQSRLKRYIVEDTYSEAHMILKYTDFDNEVYWIGDVFSSVKPYNKITYSPIAYNSVGEPNSWTYTKE